MEAKSERGGGGGVEDGEGRRRDAPPACRCKVQGEVSQNRARSAGAGFPKARGLKAIKVGARRL